MSRRFLAFAALLTLLPWRISSGQVFEASQSEAIVPMSREAARERLLLAISQDNPPSRDLLETLGPFWSDASSTLDAVVRSAGAAEPRLEPLTKGAIDGTIPSSENRATLEDQDIPSFLRSNVAAALGESLVRRRQLDEAVEVLRLPSASDLVDPASFYFHRAVCEFSLHQVAEAKESLQKLQRVSPLPARYRVMSESMLEIVNQMKRESLEGIAHDMRDVERRLDLKESEEKTLALEKDILERLDKLIEEAENQDKSSGSSSGSSSPRSTSPAQQSQLLGGKGEGKVDEKTFKDREKWGNLPDKDRERALQEIGRDFPGHYRDAIEQYFRKLAKTPAESR